MQEYPPGDIMPGKLPGHGNAPGQGEGRWGSQESRPLEILLAKQGEDQGQGGPRG